MSGLIPEDIVNRVRDAVDIVELVSRYLSLKKAGASYKALCPFHKEKTPSFIVSASRQSFHCFGCGKGGDVFHFLMAMDRVSFPEAVRTLARDAHVEIPETSPERAENAAAAAEERGSLYEANRRAADFYARLLASPAGTKAREYLKTRQISDEMVQRCRLGYASDSWDALLRAAAAAGLPPALLVKAGLALERQDGEGHYDRFRDRVMFPIFDTQDRVIGFGARTMADSEVKYLNTPETTLFSKGRNLYGLNWARKAIVDARRVAVVEGYTDVIMAHQHGCLPVVATLGTALTREHIHLLRRSAERIEVVFDADSAGQRAAERSMQLFLSEGARELVAAGFDVRIATIEGGKDPCDLIADRGPEPFQHALDAAADIFSHMIRTAAERHDFKTVEGKTKAIDEVLALIALLPNDVDRQLRIDAAIRMFADVFHLEDAVLRSRLSQLERRRRRPAEPRENVAPPPARTHDPAEVGIIAGLLLVPDLVPQIFDELSPEDFESQPLRDLFTRMRELADQDGIVNPTRLLAALEDPDLAALVTELTMRPSRPDFPNAVQDCGRRLLRRRTERRVRQLRQDLEQAKASGDEQLADALNIQYLKLQREVLTR